MRIVRDSRGNEYIDENYGLGIIMDKTDKLFLTMYKKGNKYYLLVYGFNNLNEPQAIKNIYKYMTKTELYNHITPMVHSILYTYNPLEVYSNSNRMGLNVTLEEIWGKAVYVITRGIPHIQLCSVYGMPELLDKSAQVDEKFILQNKQYLVDITEYYHQMTK